MQDFPLTDIQKKRKEMWSWHYKPGMSLTEVCDLNSKIIAQFPPTQEERKLKWESLKDMPEFVL